MSKRIFLSMWFSAIVITTFAIASSEYVVTYLPTQKQLPVANIHCILQDTEGYMWYGTPEGGLCRDNGYQVDVFRSDRLHPNLIGKSNNIRSMAEDQHHHIIFGTGDGAYVLDKLNYSIATLDPKLKGKNVDAILVASDGDIWVGANKKVWIYGANLKLKKCLQSSWKKKAVYATCIYEDKAKNIWIMQWDGGIMKYNKKSNRLEAQPWLDGITPGSMVEDNLLHCFWVATWGKGIMKYMPTENKIIPQPCTTSHGQLASQIMYVKSSSGRGIWTSTMDGLYGYRVVDGKLVPINLNGLLPQGTNIIDHLNFDRQGNLWVSGFSPLTFILSPKNTDIERITFDKSKYLFNNRFIAWQTVFDGESIWIGQDRLGICWYNSRTEQMTVPSQNNQFPFTILKGKNFLKCKTQKGIWGFSKNEVYHIWQVSGKLMYEKVCQTHEEITCLYDNGKGQLYIGKNKGLDAWYLAEKKLYTNLVMTQSIIDIIESPNHSIYVLSSKQGLICKKANGKAETISTLPGFSSFVQDHLGRLWIADRYGNLYSYQPNGRKFNLDKQGSNINGDAIMHITIDKNNHIWLMSELFIKEYNPHTGAFRLVFTQDKDVNIDYFCNIIAHGDGICACGAGAILQLKSSLALNEKNVKVSPIITSMLVDGNTQIVGMEQKEVEFTSDVNSVEVRFSTLNYLHADKITFAYRLKGLSDDWHVLQTGVNKATFYGLAKGKYTLEVKATDEYGRWSESCTTLTIHRLPAWYESWWAYTLYASLFLCVFLLVIWSYINHQKQKQKAKMQDALTEIKFQFFTNVSHELRTPLTLIITPLQSLVKRMEDVELKSRLTLILNNANRLLSLVNRLLDFRKIEMGQMKLELTNGEILGFIRNVCETFLPLSQEKGIGLGYAIPNKEYFMYFDANKLRHILTNLLSNAFKFTQEGGSIFVSVSKVTEQKLQIVVKDNGCGIDAHDINHIFERYYQSHKTSQLSNTGTGIGLNMAREFCHLHGGEVTVTSKRGKGSAFTVTLPMNLKPTNNIQKNEQEAMPKAAASDGNGIKLDNERKPRLLIVDDNQEFRQFISCELADTYDVKQACDGKEALDIVGNQDIDLVVSDIMMPNIDGMELCRLIKQDINTSHIMVILLTAKTAEESRIEGFRYGADDYISKPFNMEILRLRIAHFLDLRKKRLEKFSEGDSLKVEEIADNELDQKFLQKAIDCIEKNLNNDAYNLEAFCSDLFVSRSTCYRKIQSLTGLKPTEFIRTIRLKRATQFIREKKYTISEISDMCGFSSSSYFCRCFKAQFGISPSMFE